MSTEKETPSSNPVTDLFLAELIDTYDAAPGAHWCGRAVVDCLRELQKRRADETTSAQAQYDGIFAVIYGKRPEAMTIEERHGDGWRDANRKTLDILRLTMPPVEPTGWKCICGHTNSSQGPCKCGRLGPPEKASATECRWPNCDCEPTCDVDPSENGTRDV